MTLPLPAHAVVRFLRPDVAVICAAVLAYAAFELTLGGVISEVGGLGGDGAIHVTLAGRTVEAVLAKDATAYQYRHLLPYLTVWRYFQALDLNYDAVFGRPAIITAHRLQNVACWLIAIVLFGRVLERLAVSKELRRVAFGLLLLNFAFAKMPFYHPCNGDSAQLLLGMVLLYAYTHDRFWLLAFAGLIGFYVRPGADIYAAALLAFRPPPAGAPSLSIAGAEVRSPYRALNAFAAASLAVFVFVVAIVYFHDIHAVHTIQPPLGFLKVISVPIAVLFTWAAFYHLWRNLDARDFLRLRWAPLLFFAIGAIALRLITKSISRATGDITNELHILVDCIAYAVNKPAISQIAHVVYFGPVAILLYFLWPAVARAAHRLGPSVVAMLSVATLLGLHSESRLLTTPFPFFIAVVILALQERGAPRGLIPLTFGAGLLFSKAWFSMGGQTPWNPLDYPDLLYWINQGPWMPNSMYVVQGVVVLAFLAAFGLVLFRAELRAAAQRITSSVAPLKIADFVPSLGSIFETRNPRRALMALGLVAIALLAATPTLVRTRPNLRPILTLIANPVVIRNGFTELTVSDSRFGFPSPPGTASFEWSAGDGRFAEDVGFTNPRGARTSVRFKRPGIYSVRATVRYANSSAVYSESVLVYVQSVRTRLSTDLNNDGCADALLLDVVSGEFGADLSDPAGLARSHHSIAVEPDRNWWPRLLGDFDGDGSADVLWENRVSGAVVLHVLRGASLAQLCMLPHLGPDWRLAGVGEFNGDGRSDLLWQNTRSGESRANLMNGGTIISSTKYTAESLLDFELVDLADIDGDGIDDALWQDRSRGDAVADLTDLSELGGGTRRVRLNRNEDPDWQARALGDFDLDGRADALWRHVSSGFAFVQFFDSAGQTHESRDILVREVDRRLRFNGLGDFNGDGVPDILWRDETTGGLVTHLMSRASRTLGAPLIIGIPPSGGWQVVMLDDYNGDGRTDLLMRNDSTGALMYYYLNGHVVIGAQPGAREYGAGALTAQGRSSSTGRLYLH